MLCFLRFTVELENENMCKPQTCGNQSNFTQAMKNLLFNYQFASSFKVMMIIIEGQTKTNYDLLIVNLYEISR